MAGSTRLRRVGLLIGSLVALAPALLQSSPASAAGQGTLFAISGLGQSVLSTIDPTTAAITPIEDLAGPGNNGQILSLTGDPSTHRLFMVRSITTFIPPTTILVENQLLTVNSQTGAILSSPDLTGLANGLKFDPSTGVLFALSQTGVVRVDAATGAVTPFATFSTPGSFITIMALAPASHTIYVSQENVNFINPPSTQIFAINSQTAAVTAGPVLARAVRFIAYDTSLAQLFGTTDCCPNDLVQIDPVTGNETFITNVIGANSFLQSELEIDSGSHTLFVDLQTQTPQFTFENHVLSINDQTGVATLGPASSTTVWHFYFEGIVPITPASIQADVQKAAADGSIKTKALADSLLDKLARAAEARTDGNCKAAARSYEAFIDQVTRQSGKKIEAATATQLASEAQFLIANCP
jgi:FIMAH domain-containing protein